MGTEGFFGMVAVYLTFCSVRGTRRKGWRREDLMCLAVIGGAWVGFLAAGVHGILPGACIVAGMLLSYWVARVIARHWTP